MHEPDEPFMNRAPSEQHKIHLLCASVACTFYIGAEVTWRWLVLFSTFVSAALTTYVLIPLESVSVIINYVYYLSVTLGHLVFVQ